MIEHHDDALDEKIEGKVNQAAVLEKLKEINEIWEERLEEHTLEFQNIIEDLQENLTTVHNKSRNQHHNLENLAKRTQKALENKKNVKDIDPIKIASELSAHNAETRSQRSNLTNTLSNGLLTVTLVNERLGSFETIEEDGKEVQMQTPDHDQIKKELKVQFNAILVMQSINRGSEKSNQDQAWGSKSRVKEGTTTYFSDKPAHETKSRTSPLTS